MTTDQCPVYDKNSGQCPLPKGHKGPHLDPPGIQLTATEILRGFAGMSTGEASIRLQALPADQRGVLIEADLILPRERTYTWTPEGIGVLRAMRRRSR